MNRKHEAYSYRVTFNAMHNTSPDDPNKMHAHTFRVGMYVIGSQGAQAGFLNNEKIIEDYFGRYRGIRINDLQEFRDLTPTLENMGMIFYEDLKKVFEDNGMQLLSLDIGDSPICTYSIGERLLLGSMYHLIDEKQVDEYCRILQKRYEEKVIENGQCDDC